MFSFWRRILQIFLKVIYSNSITKWLSVGKNLIDIVQAYVSMHIGLDTMNENGLVADNARNKLVFLNIGWEMPITRKYGQCKLAGM